MNVLVPGEQYWVIRSGQIHFLVVSQHTEDQILTRACIVPSGVFTGDSVWDRHVAHGLASLTLAEKLGFAHPGAIIQSIPRSSWEALCKIYGVRAPVE